MRYSKNRLILWSAATLTAIVALAALAMRLARPSPDSGGSAPHLVVYCAAGLRVPVEKTAEEYRQRYGVAIQLQYGGSDTLLNQIKLAPAGDLYIAADERYISTARDQGLVKEAISVASQRPVIAVRKGNPRNVRGIADLLRDDVRVALGSSEQAAIGVTTRRLLTESGQWADLEKRVTASGVFKPTVHDIANDIKLTAVDAGIVWDTTVALYPELDAVEAPELERGRSNITLGVLTASRAPAAALRFARYLSARDRGLRTFGAMGFAVVEGDEWEESPEIIFYCGSVSRRAVEPVIRAFEQREGVRVNTSFNGCGILTGQMRAMSCSPQAANLPDVYLACDVYYMDNVRDLFQDPTSVSDTDIVIVVARDNPLNIQTLRDLARPGVRVVVGQPEQCTIGALTRQLLESQGLLDEVMKNVVTQTATSAMLVPAVTTGSADAALAYASDVLFEQQRVKALTVDGPRAKAVQPIAVARGSRHKELSRRFFDAVTGSRGAFEAAGFRWRLQPASTIAPASRPGGAP
jgi:molybdenum ABC transporter molybdate-binding protein